MAAYNIISTNRRKIVVTSGMISAAIKISIIKN